MKRKFYLFHSVLFLLASSLCGCGKNDRSVTSEAEQAADSGTVALTVWGAEEDEELIGRMIDGFQEKYRD